MRPTGEIKLGVGPVGQLEARATRSTSKKIKILGTKKDPIKFMGDVTIKGSEVLMRGPITIAEGATVKIQLIK
jgi:hypothetical protein